jgi:endonuclease-8
VPEGDSIHTLAERLRPLLEGRKVLSLRARAIPDAAAEEIAGRHIRAVEARGKHLLIRFEPDRVLHVHLRMGGRIVVERPRSRFWTAPARTLPDLRLAVAGTTILGQNLPVCRLLFANQEKRALAALGPDLVEEDVDLNEAIRRLRALGPREIAVALLDQRAMSGIGNVYKSEVLFLEGIDPRARVASLGEDALRAVVERASVLLRRNVGPGPRTTRSALRGPRLWVYGRGGRPCIRCGTAIARFKQGPAPGRSTYWCPTCQARDEKTPESEAGR